MTDINLPLIIVWALIGGATTLLYLLLLWISVQRFVAGGRGAPLAWGLTAVRFALLAGLLFGAMHFGLPAVAAALVGFFLCRSLCLAQMRPLQQTNTTTTNPEGQNS